MTAIKIVTKGIAASFTVTCVLSALMPTKQWLPQPDTITVLDGVARDLILPPPFAGWLWHFVVGCLVCGWMYTVMEPILPGAQPWEKVEFRIWGGTWPAFVY